MIAIFVYFVVELAQAPVPITYKDVHYPNEIYGNVFSKCYQKHFSITDRMLQSSAG